MKKSYILAALCATATCAATVASAEVKSSVFDDVKVWYKGSAGNAIGTEDSGNYQVCNVRNLPQLADASSSMHGGAYHWWGWRMSYENQPVVCPYANVTLDSTPCMVVKSPVTTNGMETVTINGVEQEQPKITYRTGDLHFTNWMADRDSACANYTVVLRFRNEAINPLPGTQNRVLALGAVWTSSAGYAAGFDFRMTPMEALGNYSCPRFVVGNNQDLEPANIRIRDGNWVDCAIAVSGQTLTATLCWEDDGTNAIARVSYTYPISGPQPAIAANCTARIGGNNASSCVFINGYGVVSGYNWTYGFRGAFHQIAFWDRTLSDNEIREAMAGGAGRPNLVQVGIEGNGINEFAASGNVSSVANSGAWENLNPSLTSGNPTATISFTCPALWAGMPQWLRVCGASGSSGKVSASINGTSVGECNVPANRVGHIFVPANVIASGANTLVLTRASGSPVLDAVTLGGSWKFGENVSSFNNAAVDSSLAGKVGPDCWVFNPACGNDKFHARGTTWSINGDKFSFPFFVPADLIGKFHGELMFKSSNAAESGGLFSSQMNDTLVRDTSSYAKNTEYSSIVPENAFVAGWNEAAWNREAYWINFDTFQFTLVDAPKPTIIVLE